jgi:hypothetical protein
LSKKNKKKVEADEINPVVVNRSPGFSSIFKEYLAWWFKPGKPELLSDRFILNQWLRLGDSLIVSHAASVTLR